MLASQHGKGRVSQTRFEEYKMLGKEEEFVQR
jgi:hypothetical protein